MAHATRIITEEFPEGMRNFRRRAEATDFNGKMFIVMTRQKRNVFHDEDLDYFSFYRHNIVSGETEVFDWCEGIRDYIVNIYTLGDDLVVVVTHNGFETNRITQHVVQLRSKERPPRITVPTYEKNEEYKGVAYTNCTRTKKLPGRDPLNCKVTVAMGQVYSGWLLVNVRESYREDYERSAHLIASNPLHIDRYPDADLSKMVVELSGLANEKAFQLFHPILAKNGVFYLLTIRPQPDHHNRHSISTRMIGVIYFLGGNKYRAELVPFGNTEDVNVNPEFLEIRSKFVLTQYGGVGYLVFNCPNEVILESRKSWWKKKRIAGKMFFSKTTFCLFDSLDTLTEWRWCYRIASRAYDWKGRLESARTPPPKNVVYSIDCNHMRLRVIPCEPEYAERSDDVTINSMARGAPNGAFFLVSLPHQHREYYGKRKSPLIVTLLWEPTNPPSLKEIAQRRVMSLFPEYRKAEFRKRYGLLEYDGEETRTNDAEDVRSMNTSYSLMDVRSEFRSHRSGQSPEQSKTGISSLGGGGLYRESSNALTRPGGRLDIPQRSTSKSSLLDSTQPLYSSFYSINEEREQLLKSSGGSKMVLSILE